MNTKEEDDKLLKVVLNNVNDNIKDIYNNFEGKKQLDPTEEDLLKLAEKTIKEMYPVIKDTTGKAWEDLKRNKKDIESFYTDILPPLYASEKALTLEDALTETKKEYKKLLRDLNGKPYAGGRKAFNLFIKNIKSKSYLNNYKCDLFPATYDKSPVTFPISTLSFIAGRPSAGKTTALVSIAMHAIRNTNKSVLFITSEETPTQLIMRFIKNQFCFNCMQNKEKIERLLKTDYKTKSINEYFQEVLSSVYTEEAQFLEGFNFEKQSNFTKELLQASDQIQQYISTGRLQLYDLAETTDFQDLIDVINEQEQYSIILLDYIQNLPYGAVGNTGGNEGGRREDIRQSTNEINNAIKRNDLIGIAGAQFNREGADEYDPQPLDLTNMGDSGSLERIAHIVIGLGRMIKDDNLTYFYTVLKNREGEKSPTHYKLLSNYYGYSYVRADTTSEYNKDKYELIPINLKYTKKKAKGNKGSGAEKEESNTARQAPSTVNDLLY